MSDKDDYWEKRYWPFEVLPKEKQTERDRQEITFLDSAFQQGFRSFVFGAGSMGATSEQRGGEILVRGRMRWEIVLTTTERTVLSAYLDDLGCATKAVLDWLLGIESHAILEEIKDHLVRMPGARQSHQIYEAT